MAKKVPPKAVNLFILQHLTYKLMGKYDFFIIFSLTTWNYMCCKVNGWKVKIRYLVLGALPNAFKIPVNGHP